MDAEEPTLPVVGARSVAEASTVKSVPEVTVLVPSETTTVSGPAGTAGMVKVTVALPVGSVVPPPVMVAFVPPTVTVSDVDGKKPVAEIDAEDPTVPIVGLRPLTAALLDETVTELLVPLVADQEL
jgi:hypothetical protein